MLTGIQDLPRKETKSAIASCHRGGVLVIMVTGDNKLTARAIADQVGITSPNDTSENMVR
jgi:P-type E1-E2 ATPase